jgi:phosphohistidine phosphatase SixA
MKKANLTLMHCVLFRHGDKEYSSLMDPPLSAKGFQQSKALLRLVDEQKLPKPKLLLSSPKVRAVQTFEKLMERHPGILRLRPELEERQSSEEASQFLHRIRQQISWLATHAEQSQETCFLVTHSDWIGEALPMIPSQENLSDDKYQWWRPGQYLHFQIENGLWKVENFAVLPTS